MSWTAVNVAERKTPPSEPEDKAIPQPEERQAAGMAECAWLRDELSVAVRAVCPYWLVDHREDIVQVAMMAVLRQQKKVEGNRRFPSSYLRKAAFTATVDEIRRRRSRGEVPLETAEGELTMVETSAGPERHYRAREISVGIRGCLETLAPPRRSAVTLHLLSYRVPQIAAKMGWDGKRAENLVYRGMENLRQCLRAKGLEP